ncbi:MAG: hypothetical protein LH468_06415 [Nocardioides sp.]|nr:hypothetical protein [Nocardioides sp.]
MEAVTVDGWQGGRGQAAYALSRAAEQDKWAVYATLLAKAGATLSTYAGRFTAAQSKAADAIARWTEGEEATEAALTQP